jgi:hypothetical protein
MNSKVVNPFMIRKMCKNSSPTIKTEKIRHIAKRAQANPIISLNICECPSAQRSPTDVINTIKFAAAKEIMAMNVL